MIDQHDLAAGLHHAQHLVERRHGFRHSGDDIGRDDDVERLRREGEPRRVHHAKALDIAQPLLVDALLRPPQHRLGKINADDAGAWHEHRQLQPCADADIEHQPAGLRGGGGAGAPARMQRRVKNEIVKRRPVRIGLAHMACLDFWLRTAHKRSPGRGRPILSHAAGNSKVGVRPFTRASISREGIPPGARSAYYRRNARID